MNAKAPKAASLATLTSAADALEQRLAALPEIRLDGTPFDYQQSRFHYQAALQAIVADLGLNRPPHRTHDDWNGARVTYHGLRATCTAGLAGALHNWIAAVRRQEALDRPPPGPPAPPTITADGEGATDDG